MTPCIWYVSDFRSPWEGLAIGNLAAAIRARGVPLRVFVEGGTANIRAEGVVSWNSLTLFERLLTVCFRGKLWHLWGKPPLWWGIVRLRARTVQTSLDASVDWKGHPTRLLPEQVREGEYLIKPTFEVKVWTENGAEEDASTVLSTLEIGAAEDALTALGLKSLSPSETNAESVLKKGGLLLAGDGPSDVLLAAFLSMQGLPVVALSTPVLQAVLGKGGYVPVAENTPESWKKAIETALSDEGRSVSASARRFMKENYTAADSAESLLKLYRSVSEGKSPD